MGTDIYSEALEYHRMGRKGKIEVVVTKPFSTQKDLSLAYSPGVARPCQEIAENSEDAYEYTAKGNLVAVISNGSAVLGLGNIGALAGKPVMEGKGALFKKFADIDVFDIEVSSEDPDEFVRTCELISPTFGGINLEDIKAPECFYIEEKLKELVDIPVFHDSFDKACKVERKIFALLADRYRFADDQPDDVAQFPSLIQMGQHPVDRIHRLVDIFDEQDLSGGVEITPGPDRHR